MKFNLGGKATKGVHDTSGKDLSSEDSSLQYLIELSKRLLVESDVNKILTLAMDHAISLTNAQRGIIILFDGRGENLFETARNLNEQDIEEPIFEISRTIIEKVKTDGKSICLPDALADPALMKSKSVSRLKVLSVICLPLKYGAKVFGVVYLDNRTLRGTFDAKTCQFAENFADFISLAAYHALEKKKLSNRISCLETELRDKYHFESIIGHHPKILEILKLAGQVADTDATVILKGENGTGKELIARALHYNSRRKSYPFIPINCGALSENLLESELFGHVKGAFTGAIKDKIGYFERASGGTIFLDEISEMPPSLQVKLLRVLQTGEYSPVGSSDIFYCDVRFIAATNKIIEQVVRDGNFREDLYYRLKVIELELPPLRERKSDIPALVGYFIKIFTEKYKKQNMTISEDAKTVLLAHDYPGNIRELENIIQHTVVLNQGKIIEQYHLPEDIYKVQNTLTDKNSPTSLTKIKHHAAKKAEKEFVIDCLRTTRGHICNAAKMAGIDSSNFHKLLKKHTINPSEFKKS